VDETATYAEVADEATLRHVDRAHVDMLGIAPGADHQGRAPGHRSPGQTGHRPARHLAPCRDPAVLARVFGWASPPARRLTAGITALRLNAARAESSTQWKLLTGAICPIRYVYTLVTSVMAVSHVRVLLGDVMARRKSLLAQMYAERQKAKQAAKQMEWPPTGM
jgi:hypothetical protein